MLKDKINKKTAKICVIGMGYVGLPLAVAFAKKGYFVYGFDTSSIKVQRLQKGVKYIADIDPNDVTKLIKSGKLHPSENNKIIAKADVVIICVPTPLRKIKIPDISYVVKASATIRKNLKSNQLVVLESTSYPATTREVVLPELKKSGLKEGHDFFLCFSPERVNPGDKKYPLTKIPKVVGGLSAKSSELAKALYSRIIKDVVVVSSPEVAETSKLLENTFRLVNIGLANEFAMICHKMGIDVWEVIEAAKTKPFGFMPFYPGPGAGGHCLPADPVYLSWKAKKLGFKTKMIDLAVEVNHFMPKHIVCKVKDLLTERKIPITTAKVLILGVTYKKDVNDLRESPALDIIEGFMKNKIKVDYYDPLVPYLKIGTINLKAVRLTKKVLAQYDCVALITAHTGVNYEFIRKNAKLVFDTRNTYKKKFDNIRGL
ncbi:MAG: nucleotide sugar dehydrogenase [Candidatus Omnitrophica bacterium]|nr:nucleotide sugar dehydrogenase [Candidatus Omnitrophota bacterium]